MIGTKVLISITLIECVEGMHAFIRGRKWTPSREGEPSNILQSCNNGIKRNWVAMNVGTLVASEERMLENAFMRNLQFHVC
jgi:hypothetical protein